MKPSFSNIEIVTLAVYFLGGESTYIDVEDIAFKASELAPGRFFQITEWKKQLLAHAEEIYNKDRKPDQGTNVKDLHAKIGQLSMENDFLSSALGRIGDASAKR